jgi:hypothetical protein
MNRADIVPGATRSRKSIGCGGLNMTMRFDGMNRLTGAAIAALSLSLAGAAYGGTIQTTTSVYQLDSSEPGLPNYIPSVTIPAIETINPTSLPADASLTLTPSANGTQEPGIVTGSLSGQYAAPYSQTGKLITNSYFSAGLGKITINYSSEKTYFGLLWGSVDSYNSLIFNNVKTVNGVTTTTQVAALTGNSVLSGANGNQAVGGAVWLNMDFLNGFSFNQVVFADTNNQVSFEFAAVSTNSVNVPITPGGSYDEPGITVAEPSSLAALGAGLLGIAAIARRRSTKRA